MNAMEICTELQAVIRRLNAGRAKTISEAIRHLEGQDWQDVWMQIAFTGLEGNHRFQWMMYKTSNWDRIAACRQAINALTPEADRLFAEWCDSNKECRYCRRMFTGPICPDCEGLPC